MVTAAAVEHLARRERDKRCECGFLEALETPLIRLGSSPVRGATEFRLRAFPADVRSNAPDIVHEARRAAALHTATRKANPRPVIRSV
mmetsp:Transcript_14852/g.28012  ORF Transcript_14852/g.28012 Transcript_14852/m.28012 type:complete len:88 (-) Transcript_14852:2-265(-)